jgi:hypothetical protein
LNLKKIIPPSLVLLLFFISSLLQIEAFNFNDIEKTLDNEFNKLEKEMDDLFEEIKSDVDALPTQPPPPEDCDQTKPSNITSISARSGENKVYLSWTGGQPLTYYQIRYGRSTDNYDNQIDVGKVNSYDVTGLSGNTAYYFQVRAVNDCQPGNWSSTVGVSPSGEVLVEITQSSSKPTIEQRKEEIKEKIEARKEEAAEHKQEIENQFKQRENRNFVSQLLAQIRSRIRHSFNRFFRN